MLVASSYGQTDTWSSRRPRWLHPFPRPPGSHRCRGGVLRSPESNRANIGWWRGRDHTAAVTWSAGYRAVRANDAGKSVVVKRGDRLQEWTSRCRRRSAIEGRVVDENGDPLSMMTVVAARILTGSDSPQRGPHPPALTDDLGRYRIFGLEPGEYVVATEGRQAHRAVSCGRIRARAGALALPGTRATQPTTLSSVGDERSSGAADPPHRRTRRQRHRHRRRRAPAFRGLRHRARLPRRPGRDGQRTARRGHRVRRSVLPFHTDADGRFRARALEPGNYRLLVGRGGAVNGRVEYADVPLSVAGDIDGLVVSTQPGAAVSGRVVLAEGQSLDTRTLRISLRASGVAVRTVETIADEWTTTGAFGRRTSSGRTWFAWPGCHRALPSRPCCCAARTSLTCRPSSAPKTTISCRS